MLEFYPRQKPRLILDATINRGRFWTGNNYPVIGLDINHRYRPHVVGDNMRMPFRSEAFEVVIYDPPHIPNQGRDRQKDFQDRFGLGENRPRKTVTTSLTSTGHSLRKPTGF